MPVPTFAQGVKSASYWMSHYDSVKPTTVAAKTDSAKPTATASADSGSSFWDNVLDVVNPLQHLPVVGTIYRAATGDKIGDLEKVAGDTLYGGPIGLVSSLADLAFEKVTGKDFGDTVMAFVGLDQGTNDNNTALAANTSKAAGTNKTVAMNSSASPAATGAPTPLVKMDGNTAVSTPSVELASAKPAAMPNPSTPVDISTNTDLLLQALARNGVTGQMQTQALDAYRRTMSMNTTPLSASVN